MKPRRTHQSNAVFRLPGGTEDNDLWLEQVQGDAGMVLCSTWQPTSEERQRIAAGENIELCVFGEGHPPVSMRVTNTPLGASPRDPTNAEGRRGGQRRL